jgi:hypothetical protein
MKNAKKKRGGQPHNKNAYLHGFYSEEFKIRESRLLGELPATDLTGEIELIRVLTSRYLESARSGSQPLDPETHLEALRAVTQGANAISALIRLQRVRALADKKMEEMMEKLNSFPSEEPQADGVDDDDTGS